MYSRSTSSSVPLRVDGCRATLATARLARHDECCGVEHVAVAAQQRALEHVAQLADVARPVVAAEHALGVGADA